MGNTESVVRQHLTNERDFDLLDSLKNSTQQICDPSIDSSNIINLEDVACSNLNIKQSNSAKATCYLSAVLDNLSKTNLSSSAQNDLVADALAKGGIFPAESTVMQDVINSESYTLNKSTINEAIFKCAQKVIGTNVINGKKLSCDSLNIEQTNTTLAECIQSSTQSNVTDTTIKSEFVTTIEGTAEAIGLDPTASFALSVVVILAIIILPLLIMGASGSAMPKGMKIAIGICVCVCCLLFSVVGSLFIYYEVTKDDEKSE